MVFVGLAGVVVLVVTAGFAELVPRVVVVVVAPFTVVVAAAVVAAVGGGMLPDAGVLVVDAEAGKLVSGVGSGGNGLDNTLAINSFIPASDPLRNLYQVLRSSIHCFFWV